MNDISDVVKSGLCIGCGVCSYANHAGKMIYSHKYGHNIPLLNGNNQNDKTAFNICPGKGYQIIEESGNLFANSQYDPELGRIYEHYAVHSNDAEILKNASSGGIMTQTAIFLLEKNIVDKVLTAHFSYDSGVKTYCMLAGNKEEVLKSQGSKYCPVDLSEAIHEIKLNNFRVAIIGTPCQIAGIRNIQKHDSEFSSKIFLTIGNFCGGIKKFSNINLIAKRKGIDPERINFFQFRGNGQPGSMMIKENTGKAVEIAYPGYVGMTGISKHLRCHLCVDATAELADLACGDAWLPRFLEDPNPWSVVLTRNKTADDLVQEMKRLNIITTASISPEEIKKSQHENLTSKKIRQKSRFFLYRKLGFNIPAFDGGFQDNSIDLWTELQVFSKHKIRSLLETLHLFSLVYWMMRKN